MAIFSAVPPPPQLGGAESNYQSHDNTPPDGSHVTAATVGHQTPPSANANGIDIEAWTVSALQSLSISPVARGTGSPLTIPLDESGDQKEKAKAKAKAKERPSVSIYDPRTRSSAVTPPPRPLSRRDSLKRREALLKGNEGSRQRRRWENGKRTSSSSSYSPLRALSILGSASA